MATLINLSIDLNKIDKNKIVHHANGSKYYSISVYVADQKDQYGNDASVFDSQTKEQREAKEKRNYLGNGKIAFSGNAQQPKQQSPQQQFINKPNGYEQYNGETTDSDELPF